MIRHCYFKADKSKMANCVSARDAAQHIEAPIDKNNNYPNNQEGFGCQYKFFAPGLKFQANLNIALRIGCGQFLF